MLGGPAVALSGWILVAGLVVVGWLSSVPGSFVGSLQVELSCGCWPTVPEAVWVHPVDADPWGATAIFALMLQKMAAFTARQVRTEPPARTVGLIAVAMTVTYLAPVAVTAFLTGSSRTVSSGVDPRRRGRRSHHGLGELAHPRPGPDLDLAGLVQGHPSGGLRRTASHAGYRSRRADRCNGRPAGPNGAPDPRPGSWCGWRNRPGAGPARVRSQCGDLGSLVHAGRRFHPWPRHGRLADDDPAWDAAAVPLFGALPAPGSWRRELTLVAVRGSTCGRRCRWSGMRARPAARCDETSLVGGRPECSPDSSSSGWPGHRAATLVVPGLAGAGPRLLPLLVMSVTLMSLSGMVVGLLLGVLRRRPR